MLDNTDEMLWDTSARPALEASAPKLKPLFKVLFDLCGPATRKMIGESRMAWLRQLPMELRHDNLVLMHASPGNLWRAPMNTADDVELETTYAKLNAEIVVYCHIRRPFIRKVGAMTVCNTGSVGSPYDDDPRSSYLLIDDDVPSIRRVEYDVEKEIGGCWRQIIHTKSGSRRCAARQVTYRRLKRMVKISFSLSQVCIVSYAAVTRILGVLLPGALRITISTSRPSALRKFIRRSTENPSRR